MVNSTREYWPLLFGIKVFASLWFSSMLEHEQVSSQAKFIPNFAALPLPKVRDFFSNFDVLSRIVLQSRNSPYFVEKSFFFLVIQRISHRGLGVNPLMNKTKDISTKE